MENPLHALACRFNGGGIADVTDDLLDSRQLAAIYVKPKFIFVEISPEMQGMRSGYLSMLEYFRQDADVERELENYIVYAGSPSGVLTYYHRRFIVLQRQGG
jgi:hypothetical protein